MSEAWQLRTVGESVRITKGVTYASSDYASEDDGHVFLTIKCFAKGGGFNTEGVKYFRGTYLPEQEIAPGDLLIAKTDLTRDGDIVGSPMITPDFGEDRKVLPSMDLSVLRAMDGDTDLRFLFYRLMLGDARRFMWAHSAGSTVLHLESKALPKFAFSAPKFAGQHRIAKILSTLDEAIEQTEALIAKHGQIKAGLMHDLFTRGVTPDGHLRPTREQAPDLYKESPLGWIPKEWEVERLGNILRRCGGYLQTGPFGSQLHAYEYQMDGIPVVMPQDINDGQIGTEQIARIHENRAEELTRHRMRLGDIVIARRGDLSRAAAISASEQDWVCGTGCFLLRLGQSALRPDYATYVYRQDFLQRQIAGTAVGTTMPSLNNSVMAALLFPFCDTDEQVRIVERLEEMEHGLRALSECLFSNRQLKHGLMQDLLTGRVRVPMAEAGVVACSSNPAPLMRN